MNTLTIIAEIVFQRLDAVKFRSVERITSLVRNNTICNENIINLDNKVRNYLKMFSKLPDGVKSFDW